MTTTEPHLSPPSLAGADGATPVAVAPPATVPARPAAAAAPAIAARAQGLRRQFGGRAVLDGVDLEIRPGEFVALLGRSGSGKSTLLRALAGLDRGVTGHLEAAAARAVVFQDARLLPWARVLDNVILGLRGPDRVAAGERALEEVGLADHRRAWPVTLSGGEAQRVALARALVRTPDLLLLDEPFGALDALTRLTTHRLLRELCDRHHPAVLLVTHDVDEAVLLADRVIVLTDGVIGFEAEVGLGASPDLAVPQAQALRRALLGALGVTL